MKLLVDTHRFAPILSLLIVGAFTRVYGGGFPYVDATGVTTGPVAFQYTTASSGQVVVQIDGIDLSRSKGIDLTIRSRRPTQVRFYVLPRTGPAAFRYVVFTPRSPSRHLILPIAAFDPDLRAHWDKARRLDSLMVVDCPGFFRKTLVNQIDIGPVRLLAQAPAVPPDEVAPPPTDKCNEDPLYRRILGGWIGKASGTLIGGPREGQLDRRKSESERIPKQGLDDLEWGLGPDDHCSFEVQHLLVVGRQGRGFTSGDLASSWVGAFCREYLWKSERYALKLVAFGLVPPKTGDNPHGESICARIRADIWGYLAPGDPSLALEYVSRDAPIGNCREGIRAAELAAAMVSLAFRGGGVEALVADALAAQPVTDSEHCLVVRHCLEDFKAGHSLDEALSRLDREVLQPTLKKDPDDAWVTALPNTGLLTLALLYGRGDFARTIALASELGWDSDCNAGTAGCILGVLGTDTAIPAAFKDRLHDRLRVAIAGREHWSIRRLALLTRNTLDQLRATSGR